MSLKDFLKQLNLADPSKVKVRYNERRNSLQVSIDGIVYYDIIPRRPFPFSRPHFIIFTTKEGEEICMVKDYRKLDKKSKGNLERILEKIYFVPRITKIKKIKYYRGEHHWEVSTNKGECSFITRGRSSISRLPDGRIVLQDVHDNVYEIRPWELDKKSLEKLELVL